MAAVPALSSRPAAYQKLYIDFDGDYTASWGSYKPGTTPAYDSDGNPSNFSSTELSNIQQIWARVAEKYSPFNIDVTTVDPGSLADGRVMKIVVGGNGSWSNGAGGITWINGFKNSMSNIGFVFSNNLANGTPQYTAEAIAHESGHGFGLSHQAAYSGSYKTAAYNPGNGATAPAMGNSYTATRGIWWYGPTEASSTSYQDDLAVLSNSLGYRTDDVGNSIYAASPLSLSGTAASASGVIERTSDSDFYSFSTSGGNATFTANPSAFGGMLDLKLSIVNSSGATVASASTGSLAESLSTYLSAGNYFVVVASQGNYGDVGQYSISGSIGGGNSGVVNPPPTNNTGGNTDTGTTYAPSAPSSVSASATSSSTVSLSWSDNSSNETGFKIERLLDGGSWATVTTVGAGVRAYVDSGLSAKTSYAYRIRATNAAGDSAYSNAAWVTTLNSGSSTPTTPTNPSTDTSNNTGNVTATKVTGTVIGTTGSWNNSGATREKALDGNLSTYFDSAQATNATLGYDLGSAKVISFVRFAPRSGVAWRMVGGVFQGSNDNSNWTTLYTVTSEPAEGSLSTGAVSNSTAFRYVRYMAPANSYGNVAEVEFYSGTGGGSSTPSTSTGGALTGSVIGTPGSWNNSGNTIAKVFDGDLNTYLDSASSQAWAGLDLGATKTIGGFRFAPRSGLGFRMVGGTFQGSNDGSNWNTLYTINAEPASGALSTATLSSPASYRYVRYLSPTGGYGNIAEMQVLSAAAAEPIAAETITIITTPSEEIEAHATPVFSTSPISDLLIA